MPQLNVDLDEVSSSGRDIEALAHMMPDPSWGPSCDTGVDAITSLLDQTIADVNDNVLGAAGEMFRLGQAVTDAAAALGDADAQLAEG